MFSYLAINPTSLRSITTEGALIFLRFRPPRDPRDVVALRADVFIVLEFDTDFSEIFHRCLRSFIFGFWNPSLF